jgi:hypothetical protein
LTARDEVEIRNPQSRLAQSARRIAVLETNGDTLRSQRENWNMTPRKDKNPRKSSGPSSCMERRSFHHDFNPNSSEPDVANPVSAIESVPSKSVPNRDYRVIAIPRIRL